MCETLLVAFDFDHTISDDNTDIVARNLLPDEKLLESVKNLYRSNGWIAYMGKIFELLHEHSVDQQQIENAIINIPPVPGIELLLKEFHSRGYEVIIISDSNSIFINQWLRNRKLDHIISQIFTNPAQIDSNGMMKIDVYHKQNWCELSTENLCKGQILQDYIKKRLEDGVTFNRVLYVGDGWNDLCPALSLSENDLVFPRMDYALIKVLNNPKNSKVPVMKAQVIPWSCGTDILQELDCRIK